MLTIETVNRPEAFARLRSSWNQLLDRYPGADFMLTHEFVSMSWEAFCQGAKLSVLLVKDGTRLVGIAPLIIRTERRLGIGLRRLCFLHGGSSYDRGDFIIPERVEECLQAVFTQLVEHRTEWDVATFAGIPESSTTLPLLDGVTRRCGLSLGSRRPFGEALILPVSGTWDDLLKAKGRHFRKHLTQADSKLRRLGKAEVLTWCDPDSVRRGVELLYAIHGKNREREGGQIPESDHQSALAARRLADLWMEQGRGQVKILQVDGRTIAGLFSVIYRDCLYALIIKYDKEYAPYSPGWIVLHHVIRDGWEEKIKRIDFLMRWPYVERWTTDSKKYLKIDCFHKGLFSQGVRYGKRYLLPMTDSVQRLWKTIRGKTRHATLDPDR